MSLMECPHCGAENFTMEGWEDLDQCSSCGKPLGDLQRDSAESLVRPGRGRIRKRRSSGRDECNAKRPRSA
jgi:hypothetical protein